MQSETNSWITNLYNSFNVLWSNWITHHSINLLYSLIKDEFKMKLLIRTKRINLNQIKQLELLGYKIVLQLIK